MAVCVNLTLFPPDLLLYIFRTYSQPASGGFGCAFPSQFGASLTSAAPWNGSIDSSSLGRSSAESGWPVYWSSGWSSCNPMGCTHCTTLVTMVPDGIFNLKDLTRSFLPCKSFLTLQWSTLVVLLWRRRLTLLLQHEFALTLSFGVK